MPSGGTAEVTVSTTGEIANPSPAADGDESPESTLLQSEGSASTDRFVVDVTSPGSIIDPRVFGTNVPAWLGPDRLASQVVIDETIESGTTLLRMPGGSWSNSYDWAACEQEDETGCFWTWAASPTEFIDFLQATDLPGMWTVSVNESAQGAAAAVAFFNGSVGDDTVLGVDRDGVDWGTVDRWARLRRDHGNREPVDLHLWEIGNEVYGGRAESGGDQCAGFGWEDVWTCDGTEYIEGVDDHDGYLAMRSAMLAVDPTIQVGAVGVADPSSWSDWGNEVIEAGGSALDFYVLHHYGFDRSPTGDAALGRPAEVWPELLDGLSEQLGGVPIAVTEHNLVSFDAGDTERSMTTAMNALYLAETLGQLVSHGVPIANQWALASGTALSGTNYGLIDVEDYRRLPVFHAMQLWSAAGQTLHDVKRPSGVDHLRIYPTSSPDDTFAVIMINLAGNPAAVDVLVESDDGWVDGRLTSVRADELDADSLVEMDPIEVDDGPRVSITLPAWSINVWSGNVLEGTGGA